MSFDVKMVIFCSSLEKMPIACVIQQVLPDKLG